MTQSRNFTETRTVEGVVVTPSTTFGYVGLGFKRSDFLAKQGINAGHPSNLLYNSGAADGFIPGDVKIVRMTSPGAEGWYSLRSIGSKGDKRTVYLKGNVSIVVVDGHHWALDAFYAHARG